MAEGEGQVYLVTGGAGFLGTHLVKMLVQRGIGLREVRVFDREGTRQLEELGTETVRVTSISGDIRNLSDVRGAARGVDLVFHTAAIVDLWGSTPDHVIWDINYGGTRNVVEVCKELGIQYLLHTSSMEVVGPNMKGNHFIRGDEDTPYDVSPEGPYACSKAQAERLVLNSNRVKVAGGKLLFTCALRPTGIYGEENPVMEKVFKLLVKFGRKRLRLAGKEVEHGRVYVGNVAWMHVLAARGLQERPGLVGGEAYFCYDDSPRLSYEEFDMEFLGSCGFRMLGQSRPPLPFCLLYLLALLSEGLSWILWPVVRLRPLLNRCILRLVTTAFTVSTDKAGRHFGYAPLYSWGRSRALTLAWVRQLDGRL